MMKVTVEQTGGFVGYLRKMVDTSELAPEEGARFRSLVEQSNLLGRKGEQHLEAGNLPSYTITIETDQDVYQVAFDEASKPESAAPLLRYVQQRGKPLPPP